MLRCRNCTAILAFLQCGCHFDQKLRCSKQELQCNIEKAALQESGAFLPLSCGFQAPTFRHPRLGPADNLAEEKLVLANGWSHWNCQDFIPLVRRTRFLYQGLSSLTQVWKETQQTWKVGVEKDAASGMQSVQTPSRFCATFQIILGKFVSGKFRYFQTILGGETQQNQFQLRKKRLRIAHLRSDSGHNQRKSRKAMEPTHLSGASTSFLPRAPAMKLLE